MSLETKTPITEEPKQSKSNEMPNAKAKTGIFKNFLIISAFILVIILATLGLLRNFILHAFIEPAQYKNVFYMWRKDYVKDLHFSDSWKKIHANEIDRSGNSKQNVEFTDFCQGDEARLQAIIKECENTNKKIEEATNNAEIISLRTAALNKGRISKRELWDALKQKLRNESFIPDTGFNMTGHPMHFIRGQKYHWSINFQYYSSFSKEMFKSPIYKEFSIFKYVCGQIYDRILPVHYLVGIKRFNNRIHMRYYNHFTPQEIGVSVAEILNEDKFANIRAVTKALYNLTRKLASFGEDKYDLNFASDDEPVEMITDINKILEAAQFGVITGDKIKDEIISMPKANAKGFTLYGYSSLAYLFYISTLGVVFSETKDDELNAGAKDNEFDEDEFFQQDDVYRDSKSLNQRNEKFKFDCILRKAKMARILGIFDLIMSNLYGYEDISSNVKGMFTVKTPLTIKDRKDEVNDCMKVFKTVVEGLK